MKKEGGRVDEGQVQGKANVAIVEKFRVWGTVMLE